ncbi:MAG: hypothetical protein ACRC1K_05150, partial [Planctomycetia bacterium]
HYMVLRHADRAVAAGIGAAAADVVDNPLQFDLQFDAAKLDALKGKPLRGAKVNTYCAGLPLLCADAAGLPRSATMPIGEYVAGGETAGNLDRLGLKIGREFISPTTPLYAPGWRIAHRGEPLYSPRVEVEQRIFDAFAEGLRDRPLSPAVDLYQELRTKLAAAADGNPILAQALAAAAGVDPDTEFAAAAKALAVVETLDAVAYQTSGEYADAVSAFDPELVDPPPEVRKHRENHPALWEDVAVGRIDPREASRRLEAIYIERGRSEVGRRLFRTNAADR